MRPTLPASAAGLVPSALFFMAQDAVEIDAVQGDEAGRRVQGRVGELRGVVGHEPFGEIGVGRGDRVEAREVQRVD
jgi:hypothetical protein